MTGSRLWILGAIGFHIGRGRIPAGWWIISSAGWQTRYEVVFWRLFRRVEKERYPMELRRGKP